MDSWSRDPKNLKGRKGTVFKYVKAYLYTFFSQYFYIKFSYICFSSFSVFTEIQIIDEDNVFDYFASTMFFVYTLIVVGRFVFDINNPSRVAKVEDNLKLNYFTLNDTNWITNIIKRNIYTICFIRKVLITALLFLLAQPS